MAAHPKALIAIALAVLLAGGGSASVTDQVAQSPSHQVTRIVSLVPAVTEMLYEIGAGRRVVGVSSYDTFPPEVKGLPNVGALLDPNVELILSLKPDLVILYGSQTELKQQLARAGVGTYEYRHAGLAGVTATLRELAVRTGDAESGVHAAARIERGMDAIRRRVSGRPRPRTLLVFGRERLALRGIYASGGTGFLHDMLEAAGGTNVFAEVKRESVQASTEQILAKRPDVILETRAANSAFPSGDRDQELAVWSALASLPAVRSRRVLFLFDDRIVIPGPRVVQGTTALARALHPEAFAAAGAEPYGATGAERATKRERSEGSASEAPEGTRRAAAGAER